MYPSITLTMSACCFTLWAKSDTKEVVVFEDKVTPMPELCKSQPQPRGTLGLHVARSRGDRPRSRVSAKTFYFRGKLFAPDPCPTTYQTQPYPAGYLARAPE